MTYLYEQTTLDFPRKEAWACVVDFGCLHVPQRSAERYVVVSSMFHDIEISITAGVDGLA